MGPGRRLPALVYAVQNSLTQLAYRHLDGLTFNLLNQTKTLFAALCVYLLMGKGQTPRQMVALGGLLGAVDGGGRAGGAGPGRQRRPPLTPGRQWPRWC
jgi:hypothetical protein